MLHVHRAERADGLVAALGDLLAVPPADPFAPELVAVPSRGVERWLAQTLSMRFGVCANVEFPSPHRIVVDAVAAACEVDPDADPWRPERSAWTLLETVEANLAEPWLARLAGYLGTDTGDEVKHHRRLSIVRHLAELFDRYALHRPDTVRGWASGEDDGWQAELWRHLRARIGTDSPAERLAAATARLTEDAGASALPARLSLFGLTRLPAGHRDVLAALATHRDVHLLLLHPSPAQWDAIATSRSGSSVARADVPPDLAPPHPLLASWGRDVRELQLVVQAVPHEDHHHPVEHAAGTQLASIQADIRAARLPSPAVADGSVEVHACHGRARQVEVLHDVVLRLLASDETLEPRDIIVMCPDVEAFAPLIGATFAPSSPSAAATGTGGTGDAAERADGRVDLRVRLADRSLRQTNPVLGVLAALLELASARVTASEVLDLADREPVRRRFRFDDDALVRLQEWIAATGTRWGLDRQHRAPYRVDGTSTGTWRFGVDRLLAGVTMTEDDRRLLHGVLPLDDVDSTSIELAGAFTELIARLEATVDAFSVAKPPAAWAVALAEAADRFAATAPRDAWQRAQLQRILDDLVDHAGDETQPLALPEVRALLADRLAGSPTRANFRTGHLTVCTLVPMRSVPHRIVCLLGLDEESFPRKAPRDGDDLMLADPRIGERDPRSEDRQLLLDAVLAARERLVITYTGNDERTNAVRPPAVPLGELIDVAGAGVVTRHPLQPFDPGNFSAEAPRSFDATMLAGARALRGPRRARPPLLPDRLPALHEPVIELEELVRFADHPVRRFLRRRLGVEVRDFNEEVADGLSIELDHLEQWGIGDRLLRARLAGVGPAEARAAEQRRGVLPPGALAEPLLEDIAPRVEAIVAEAGDEPARSVEVRLTLPDGRPLRGTVPDVCGTTVRTVVYSNLAAKHRIHAWVRLLALTVSDPGTAWVARTVGRRGRQATVRTIAPLDPAGALHDLAALVALYERGMREALPLPCKTSAALADAGHPAADKEWTSTFDNPRENREIEYQRAFGGELSYAQLKAMPDYEALAHQLWDPLLTREVKA